VRVLLLALAATAAAGSVVAQSPAPTAPAPSALPAPVTKPGKDPNDRVCKSLTTTGSRVPARQCMTRREWQARAEADRAMTEEAQRRGLTSCGTNPCQ